MVVVVGLDGAAVDVDAVAVDVGAALAMLSFAPRLACEGRETRSPFHFRLALLPATHSLSRLSGRGTDTGTTVNRSTQPTLQRKTRSTTPSAFSCGPFAVDSTSLHPRRRHTAKAGLPHTSYWSSLPNDLL